MEKKDNIGLADLLEIYREEGIDPKINIEEFEKDYKRHTNKKAPVLIQVLMFIGALFGALFFLGFLALAGLFDSELVVLILGIVIAAVGIIIPYKSKQEAMIEPVGMAFLIVGASLFAIGFNMYGNDSFTAFLVISLFIALFVIVIAGSHLQKIAAVLCANLCLYSLIWDMHWLIGFNFLVLCNAMIITVAWLKEPAILAEQPSWGQWYPAILNGCSMAMLAVLMGSVNIYQDYYWEGAEMNTSYWWLSSILLVSLVVWTFYETLNQLAIKKSKVAIVLGIGLALLILVTAPGIIAGILLLLLGIYASYYLFAIQGIIAVFFFTVMFYYNLETTLLLKSVLMISAGVIFVALGLAIKRIYDNENVKNQANEGI